MKRGIQAIVTMASLALLSGCDEPEDRDVGLEHRGKGKGKGKEAHEREELIALVRDLAATNGISALEPAPPVSDELFVLGRALAFDKELSGNRDISCMTCHLPSRGTSDDRNLSIGQGATGLGDGRVHPGNLFIPRNAPPTYNLHTMDSLFWDGRVSVIDDEVSTPAGGAITNHMKSAFQFGAISVLPMFPVTSREEMRGFDPNTNELAAIPDDQVQAIWTKIMARLMAIAEYRDMFAAAYPDVALGNLTFAHASNAIGGYMVRAFDMHDTPWDDFLRGNDDALTTQQLRGARNFLSARCKNCHAGAALTDVQFHNVAVAQFGPGVGDGPNGNDDFGRERVTGDPADRYKFRSTPLRNVALNGPYGHAGQFETLFDFIDHYSESHIKLQQYDITANVDEEAHWGTLVDNADDILDTRDPLLDGVVFDAQTVQEVTDFMDALTDPKAVNVPEWVVPASVPSGLPIDH